MNETGTGTVCQLRDRVSQLIGTTKFRTWFGDGGNFEIQGDQVLVNVNTRFVGDWIATNYLNKIAEASSEVLGGTPRVQIRLRDAAKPGQKIEPDGRPPRVPAATQAPAHLKTAERKPAARGDLSTFVVGACNIVAYEAARRAVKELSDPYRPLVIHGGVGLGKTHLLQGVYNAVQREHPLLNCGYVMAESFVNEYVNSLKNRREEAFRNRFRTMDVLLLDDIHFLEGKRGTQAEFLHTFNAIDAAGKAIIISSDRHPRLLSALGEPLSNRLMAGTVIEVHPPDFKTRCEILRRRALHFRREVPQEVIEYVAGHITGNVRTLEGALNRLVAGAATTNGPIDMAMAKRAIAELCGHDLRVPTLEKIEEAVGARFGVTRASLHSGARDRIVSGARSVAMYLVRQHLQLSLPHIGRAMGNKNHTTVLIAKRRVEEQLQRDGLVSVRSAGGFIDISIRQLIRELETELGLGADPPRA